MPISDLVFAQQADAYLSQADPVSAQYYTVLDTTANVQIISVVCNVTWATTQPNPIVIRAVIDGVEYDWVVTNPVSATNYFCQNIAANAQNNQTVTSTAVTLPFLFTGKSVKIEIKVTWATTQPTPLVCCVRYAKI